MLRDLRVHFVVNGSPTKTEIVNTAGGRSQVAQLSTVAVVLIVILFLTQPISYLPNTVLAAIVFSIGLRLIDIKGMQAIFKTHREEFYLAIVTAATVVFIGGKEALIPIHEETLEKIDKKKKTALCGTAGWPA